MTADKLPEVTATLDSPGTACAYLTPLIKEHAATAYEYNVNHRYETHASVYVDLGSDIFAQWTQVDVAFSPAPGAAFSGAASSFSTGPPRRG